MCPWMLLTAILDPCVLHLPSIAVLDAGVDRHGIIGGSICGKRSLAACTLDMDRLVPASGIHIAVRGGSGSRTGSRSSWIDNCLRSLGQHQAHC